MEFESMDNCFPTAQDDSATTCNVPSTRGPMAPTKSNREPCGSSPRSTATASTAAITAPFQSPRFGIISAHCGRSLRKFLSSSVALPAVAATTAAIAWSGHLAAIPLSLVAPLLVYHAKSRKHAYASMFCYYAAASWPLIPGARAFFGRQGTPLIGLFLCLAAAALSGVALGFAVHARAGKSCILCATVRPAHRDPAARDHRMGFAPSFRRRSFSRLEMVRPGTHHRVSESLPLQASTERRLFGVLRSRLSFPVHATAAPCRMGSGQHKLWGRGARRPRFHDGIQHAPIHADDNPRVPRGRAALPGTPGHALE